jgi:octanoyl-[GcvH]:protein N-octanoyltransferase
VAQLQLIEDASIVSPAVDAAKVREIVSRVALGELPDTLRISRPGPSVAFGKRDVVSAGYERARAAARLYGYEPVERIAGGRASVFHEDTLHLSHTIRDADPRAGVTRRFEEMAELIARALRSLGVDARVGEVQGEYCPGEHSVNARGEVKLAGLAQRVIREVAHIGAVIVVADAVKIRRVLLPVYEALELKWRPEATGSIADEIARVEWAQVTAAIKDELARSYELVNGASQP